MTSNNQFTHPLVQLLRQHAYGTITIQRYVTTFCEGTCRDWRPLPEHAHIPYYEETVDHYMGRIMELRRLEMEMEVCQGHDTCVETLTGMLRSFSFTPPADDRSSYGNISLTVLPWDEKQGRLTSSHVVRSRLIDYNMRPHGFSVSADYGSSGFVTTLDQWHLAE